MTALRQLSEQLLAGPLAPDAQPMAPRFLAEPIAPGAYFVSSFANVAAFDTDDGLVLVDTGSFILAEPTRKRLRELTKRPVHTAVWTHGHVDHCFGVDLYERELRPPRPRDRARGRRAPPRALSAHPRLQPGDQPAPVPDRRPVPARSSARPTRPIKRRKDLDRRRPHVRAPPRARRDRRSHVGWVPDAGVVCTGDLFIWASPNCWQSAKGAALPARVGRGAARDGSARRRGAGTGPRRADLGRGARASRARRKPRAPRVARRSRGRA